MAANPILVTSELSRFASGALNSLDLLERYALQQHKRSHIHFSVYSSKAPRGTGGSADLKMYLQSWDVPDAIAAYGSGVSA